MKTPTPTQSAFNQIPSLKDQVNSPGSKNNPGSLPETSFNDYLEQSNTDALAKMQDKFVKTFFKPNEKARPETHSKSKLETRAKVESHSHKKPISRAAPKPKDDPISKPQENHPKENLVEENSNTQNSKENQTSKKAPSQKETSDSQQTQDPTLGKVSPEEKASTAENPETESTQTTSPQQNEGDFQDSIMFKKALVQLEASARGMGTIEADQEQADLEDAEIPTEGVQSKPVLEAAEQITKLSPKENLKNSPVLNPKLEMTMESQAKEPTLDVKNVQVQEGADGISDFIQGQEKSAEAKASGGKNITVGANAPKGSESKPSLPTSMILSAMATADSISKGDLGIKDALKSYMRENNNMAAPVADVETGKDAPIKGSFSAATSAARPAPAPVPVRMTQLIERVQQAIESQTPHTPKQITFQVEPHSLGLVSVNMSWSAEGWNVNWSVTKNEVREWLSQNMPTLQQDQSKMPILWHAPTLQSNAWNFANQQGHGHPLERNVDRLLADDDQGEDDNKVQPTSNEYWA